MTRRLRQIDSTETARALGRTLRQNFEDTPEVMITREHALAIALGVATGLFDDLDGAALISAAGASARITPAGSTMIEVAAFSLPFPEDL